MCSFNFKERCYKITPWTASFHHSSIRDFGVKWDIYLLQLTYPHNLLSFGTLLSYWCFETELILNFIPSLVALLFIYHRKCPLMCQGPNCLLKVLHFWVSSEKPSHSTPILGLSHISHLPAKYCSNVFQVMAWKVCSCFS